MSNIFICPLSFVVENKSSKKDDIDKDCMRFGTLMFQEPTGQQLSTCLEVSLRKTISRCAIGIKYHHPFMKVISHSNHML